MLTIGALTLVASPGGPVTAELLVDDYPTRFPFLNEPQSNRINGTLSGEQAYGQMTWIGFPDNDGLLEVLVVGQGNKAPRFQWSADGGETYGASGLLVPEGGGTVVLGTSGFSATFAASPVAEYETTYTFTEAGDADKTGTGPDVTITGSGSIDGLIEIQTGIGSVQYRVDGQAWSLPVSMADLPVTVPGLGVELDIAPEDPLGLLLETETLFTSRVRGFFTLRLTRGAVVETYERLVVGAPLWFVSSSVPAKRRSTLLSAASWSGTERPPAGGYVITDG